jgi:hypothetical protein
MAPPCSQGERGAFAFGGFSLGFCAFCLAFGFLLFALGGFLPLNIGKKLLLWAFWYGKLSEGKTIIEGKNC